MSPVLSEPRARHRSRTAPGPVILGVDPGLIRTGYALLYGPGPAAEAHVLEAGLIRLTARRPLAERLVELEDGLAGLVQTHRPVALACEELYAHYKHPRTAILMGHARGVILALAARRGLAIISVAATNAKKMLTGNGHATKAQMQRAVAATLGLPRLPEPHDVADALAIALCGLRVRQAAAAKPVTPRRARP